MKTRLLPAVCLLTIFCLPLLAHGQQDRRIVAAKKRVERYVSQQKKTSESRLLALIDDMDRICQLDQSQLKKLRFAAKGAVSSYVGKIEKQQNDVYRRQFGDAWDKDETEDNDKEKVKPVDGAANQFQRAVMVENIVFAGRNTSSYAIENEKIWKDNFSKILTDEQSSKYKTALAERHKFHRSAAVNSFIARIDKQLLLSTKQRDAITKVIDEKFGDKIANRGNQVGIAGFVRGGNQNNDPPIKYELLGDLSPNQLKIWKSSVEPQLRNMKNMIFRGAMPAAANWQFAAPQVVVDVLEPAVAPPAVRGAVKAKADPKQNAKKPKAAKDEKPKKDDK